MPYSFLADYFSNLQSVIEGHSFDFTLWTRFWETEVLQNKAVVKHIPQVPNGNYVIEQSTTGETHIISINLKRGPVTSPSFIPKFEVKVPSLAQSANIIALAASKLPVIGTVYKKIYRTIPG